MEALQPEFDNFVGETDQELWMMVRLIHSTQLGIEEVERQESERLERQRSEIEGEFAAVISAHIDHMIAHAQEFPRMLPYGQIVSLYSIVEARLRSLCEEVRKRDPSLAWKPEDFAGNMSLRTFEIFLTRAVDAGVSVWDSMNTLRLVRNCIAHGNGWIDRMDRGKSELRRRIGLTAALNEVEGRLVISTDYVVDACRDCHTLFSEAFGELGFGPGLMPFEYPPETGIRIGGRCAEPPGASRGKI